MAINVREVCLKGVDFWTKGFTYTLMWRDLLGDLPGLNIPVYIIMKLRLSRTVSLISNLYMG